MMLDYLTYGVLAVVVVLFLSSAIRILREYERGVVFTLGRFTGVKGPGFIILIPVVQQMVKVDLRVMVQVVPPQDVISRDNVSVKVNAVLYFRIIDPERAIIKVGDYMAATSQLAQTTLRSVLGKHELDEMLAERDRLMPMSRKFSISRPTSGVSRSPPSRSRISISMKPWCARLPSRPRRSGCGAPK